MLLNIAILFSVIFISVLFKYYILKIEFFKNNVLEEYKSELPDTLLVNGSIPNNINIVATSNIPIEDSIKHYNKVVIPTLNNQIEDIKKQKLANESQLQTLNKSSNDYQTQYNTIVTDTNSKKSQLESLGQEQQGIIKIQQDNSKVGVGIYAKAQSDYESARLAAEMAQRIAAQKAAEEAARRAAEEAARKAGEEAARRSTQKLTVITNAPRNINGDYYYYTFKNNDTMELQNITQFMTLNILAVGGGGSGGYGIYGGGGGGGVVQSVINIDGMNYRKFNINIGAGGVNGSNGGDTVIPELGIRAIGGGCGARSGGSGAGGEPNQAGADGTPNQGNSGGRGISQYGRSGGGGGGAGGPGKNGSSSGYGGDGGPGKTSSLPGIPNNVHYGGGGGGYSYAKGGIGGGGNAKKGQQSNSGTSGQPNTGGGAGAGDNGIAGGSGIAIIAIPIKYFNSSKPSRSQFNSVSKLQEHEQGIPSISSANASNYYNKIFNSNHSFTIYLDDNFPYPFTTYWYNSSNFDGSVTINSKYGQRSLGARTNQYKNNVNQIVISSPTNYIVNYIDMNSIDYDP